jgi:rhamnosyltransferase
MRPTVAVLLATFNGLRWLPEQVESLLAQTDVELRLFVSDDQSTDGTWAWLQQRAAQDSRITLLPHTQAFGRAAANFYRLILEADFADCDFIAFADQDDIWALNKLSRHVQIAQQGQFDGVSSGVTAFWADGRTANIVKSQAQRRWDYLFESAGPGCTYLMTMRLIGAVRCVLNDPAAAAQTVDLHDWLSYAVCRASGWRWHIDATPSVRYRQHERNEFGANHGWRAKWARLKKLRGGWHWAEVAKLLTVCLSLKPNDATLLNLQQALRAKRGWARLGLLRYVGQARRKPLHRAALAMSLLWGWHE